MCIRLVKMKLSMLLCQSVHCGIFVGAAVKCREVCTSYAGMSLCPYHVLAWHTAAPLWRWLSSLHHVEMQPPCVSAVFNFSCACVEHIGISLAEVAQKLIPTWGLI